MAYIFKILILFSLVGPEKAYSEISIEKNLPLNTSKSFLWEALTQEKHLGAWWGKDVSIEPKVGGEFFEPWGKDGLATGKVTRLKVKDFIEFTWKEKYFKGSEETLCRFTIVGTEAGVFLKLKHSGWESFKDPAQREDLVEGFDRAWDFFLSKLKKYVEGI